MLFFKRQIAALTAMVIGITSSIPSAVPAVAKTRKALLTAEEDGLVCSFYSEDLNADDQVTLSEIPEKAGQISEALGEDVSVYALHADFTDSSGNEVCPQEPVRVIIDGDGIREDRQNIRFFQISGEAMEDDLAMNLPDPQDLITDGDDDFWEMDPDGTDFAVAVTPTEDVSIDVNGTTLTAERMEKGASLSFIPSGEDDPEGNLISGTLEMDGSDFAPERILAEGDGINTALENGDSLSLRISDAENTLDIDNSKKTQACFILGKEAKEFLSENTQDKSCSISVSIISSGEKEQKDDAATYAKASGKLSVQRAPKATADVVLHEGSNTQIRSDLGSGEDGTGQEYLYSDKYITKNEGKEVNGQATYTTTIEQAVTTNKIVKINPPKKQDIVLVLDTSASMGDKVDATNEAVEKFVTEIMNVNQQRKRNWDNGEYDGTAGDTVENHLLSINAAIKYNNKVTVLNGSRITPMTQSDVNRLVNAAKLRNGYEPNGSLYDMTRTDLALSKAREYISDPADTTIVLMTDGEPYGRGDEGSLDYDTDTYSGLMMTYENTNSALRTARAIKDGGSTIYTIYVQTGYPTDLINNAKTSRRIQDLATMPSQAGGSRVLSDQSLGCAFLSLVSSDYPQNGLMHGDADGSGDHKFSGSYDNPGDGTFGEYFKMPDEIPKMVESFTDVARDIDNKTKYSFGYASESSYVYDVVSYPFNVETGTQAVSVYQVPRICIGERNGQKQFVWGDEEEITDQVTASVENGKYITVKGYNYEKNAITTINKTLLDGDEEQFPSAAGDYGYKLVVRFQIYANRVFGGNGIETNDSEISGFYPSKPSKMEEWKDNTDLNPDGTDWVTLYPVPIVDLNIDYKVVSDDIVIFAPQTAGLDNLVTDENYSMFATESNWPNIKDRYEAAKTATEKQYTRYTEAAKSYQDVMKDTSAEGIASRDGALKDLQDQQQLYMETQTEFAEARDAYEKAQNYIPNGDNNAYVDIHYVMTDPDGKEIGTMDIPHGTAYDGTNLSWEWTGNAQDGKIRKHGTYHIVATVKPVDTSREESHTGSTEAGTGSPTDFTAEPSAHIYTYRMKGIDGSVEDKEGVALLEKTFIGTEDIALTSWAKDNLAEGGWVALDGTTPEQNGDKESLMAGAISVYGGKPGVTLTVPDKTHLTGENGDFVAEGKNGDYIPVAVKVTRQTGKLDKKYSDIERTTQTSLPMNDNDELYLDKDGNKVSSITWEHECSVVPNCTGSVFASAQAKNNAMDGAAQNNVRYLLHLTRIVLPKPAKRSDSPVISKKTNPTWTVSLDNTDEESNPDRLDAVSSMVDVLPYNGDGRQDPATGEYTGSQFDGNLYYKSVTIDCSKSEQALQAFLNGTAKAYTTADTHIRDVEQNDNEVKNFAWVESTVQIDGTNVTMQIPAGSVAIKIDTTLKFGDSVAVNMTAELDNPADAKEDDVYNNAAFVIGRNSRTNTNVTKVSITSSCISGVVWEDTNSDGMRQNSEPMIKGAVVGLYAPHNPSGKGAVITVNGTQYDVVYNADGNEVNNISTGEDGSYKFNNLIPGTYYVIAQSIDGKYAVTKKHAVANTNIDSDAEEAMPALDNLGTIQIPSGKTARAWIPDITVQELEAKTHMDIGMYPIQGSVDITKTLDQIYYPSTMTEEEKALYYPTFHFKLYSLGDGSVRYGTIQLGTTKLTGYLKFADLPAGSYRLEEQEALNYHLDSIESDDISTKNVGTRTVEFTVSAGNQDYHVTFNNRMDGVPPAGDQNQVINHIPMHVPVSLKINYTGPKLIQSATAYNYTFSPEETIGTVTYDDGSTQTVKLGESEGYSLDPLTVTNMMNTKKNNTLAIHGYYSEKGRILEDSFNVQVDLKPPHKFRVIYHSNGSVFADGKDTNTVCYLYDQTNDRFFAYSGTYADPNARGDGFTYKGWGTSPNGAAGTKYDTEAALKSVAVDNNVSELHLYARWLTYYQFVGNGGTISPSRVDAYYGDYVPASPSVTATRANYHLYGWKTTPDIRSGKFLSEMTAAERKITGPRTFYAVWYRTEYTYVNSVETFEAPVDGWYRMQVWGCQGGGGSLGGKGGYAAGSIHLTAGQVLYVCVGGRANNNYGGYNGGGRNAANAYSSGGGATHIATTNRGLLKQYVNNKNDVLLVAGGGGGAKIGNDGESPTGPNYPGGYGGGLYGGSGSGPNYGTGGSQTGAGGTAGGTDCTNMYNSPGFGQGGDATWEGESLGGGGGGWYGGGPGSGRGYNGSGGGGSGHVNTSLCTNTTMAGGNELFTAPGGGQEQGHSGDGYARIVLLSRD